MKKLLFFSLLFSLSGCAAIRDRIPFLAPREKIIGGVYRDNLDVDRLVDLIIVKKLTGQKRLGLFDKYARYLEGYIRGSVVDYDDNPMQGIVVRVTDKGKDVVGFDPGVTDANGVYRVRFSLPIVKKRVDQRASLSYNPPWQQQLDILGAALEPQTKETKFRLYYNQKLGIIAIGEDTPKTITRKVTGSERDLTADKKGRPADRKSPAASPSSPSQTAPAAPPPAQAPKKNDDFFGGFGDFGK